MEESCRDRPDRPLAATINGTDAPGPRPAAAAIPAVEVEILHLEGPSCRGRLSTRGSRARWHCLFSEADSSGDGCVLLVTDLDVGLNLPKAARGHGVTRSEDAR